MKKAKKVLALFLAAVMLVCTTVAATVAYLYSKTEVVQNTFTVGQVKITLDEKDVDDDENKADNNSDYGEVRDRANEYHLFPGKIYVKDPTVHVDAKSENCFLYVKVVDELVELQDDVTVAAQMEAKGWSPLIIDGTPVENVWVYKEIVGKGMNIQVFENFKLKDDITNEELAEYAPVTTGEGENAVTTYKTIKVEAYAIQSEGFGSAEAAWKANGNQFEI